MEPNNNQQTTQPSQQPMSVPVQQPIPASAQAVSTQPAGNTMPPQAPERGTNKRIIILLILLLLVLGMAAYIFFAKNQVGDIQKLSTENTSVVIPQNTIAPPTPTPASIDEVEIASPEAELMDLESDLGSL